MRRVVQRLTAAAGAAALAAVGFVVTPAAARAQEAPNIVMEAARQVAADALRALQVAQNDPFVQQFEQQYGAQFRQLHRSELHFMRLVCQPTRPQFEKIAADTQVALTEAKKKLAASMRNGFVNDSGDPRAMVAGAIEASVRAHLSSEQADRYHKELVARAAARKRTALLSLVAAVDKLLVLTPEQRGRLEEVLKNNWNESWNHTQLLFNLGHFFPQMPEDKILPLLTEAQKTVWRGIPNRGVRFGFDLGFAGGFAIDDEVWDEDPPAGRRDGTGGKGP